jgi:hypothetical protein
MNPTEQKNVSTVTYVKCPGSGIGGAKGWVLEQRVHAERCRRRRGGLVVGLHRPACYIDADIQQVRCSQFRFEEILCNGHWRSQGYTGRGRDAPLESSNMS